MRTEMPQGYTANAASCLRVQDMMRRRTRMQDGLALLKLNVKWSTDRGGKSCAFNARHKRLYWRAKRTERYVGEIFHFQMVNKLPLTREEVPKKVYSWRWATKMSGFSPTFLFVSQQSYILIYIPPKISAKNRNIFLHGVFLWAVLPFIRDWRAL